MAVPRPATRGQCGFDRLHRGPTYFGGLVPIGPLPHLSKTLCVPGAAWDPPLAHAVFRQWPEPPLMLRPHPLATRSRTSAPCPPAACLPCCALDVKVSRVGPGFCFILFYFLKELSLELKYQVLIAFKVIKIVSCFSRHSTLLLTFACVVVAMSLVLS